MPVEKSITPVAENRGSWRSQLHGLCKYIGYHGNGAGVVVATAGYRRRSAASARCWEVSQLTTPLLRQIGSFGRRLTGIILILALCTSLYGFWCGTTPWTRCFWLRWVWRSLPSRGTSAIITITLAIGVQRMAGRNGIIRLLPAVETGYGFRDLLGQDRHAHAQ